MLGHNAQFLNALCSTILRRQLMQILNYFYRAVVIARITGLSRPQQALQDEVQVTESKLAFLVIRGKHRRNESRGSILPIWP
jgi:hypothetical protein